jgi:hypothetical protein
MTQKRILVITILLVITVGGTSIFALSLRSTQYFKDDLGAVLALHRGGRMDFTLNGAHKSGTYNLGSGAVELYGNDGSLFMTCPFQWEQQGSTIRWVEVDGYKLYRIKN